MKVILLFTALGAFIGSPSSAQEKPRLPKQAFSRVTTTLPYALMNANNLTSWVHSDGFYNWLVKQSWNGEFPKGSGVGTVFSEGIVFGGKVHDGLYSDSIRVTGDTYQVGMQPGAILSDASGNTIRADNPNDLSVRAFAVRPDMPASIQNDTTSWPDLKMDAVTFFQKNKDSVTTEDIQQIANQYFTDWLEWPAAKGAPWYIDDVMIVRTDVAFDPTNPHHIPGIPDAAKTIWYVCNDQDPSVMQSFAGSPPIGIEEQVTMWAYILSAPWEALNNVIYKQVKLIYKGNPGVPSNSHIDSMYITKWVDGDLGYGGDDFGGCDSALSLAFNYNSTAHDSLYSAVGLMAPASGYVFLQGTSYYTGNPTDSAIVSFQWRKGFRYWTERPMTAFFNKGSGMPVSDPDIGPYSGTLQWYNIMRGDVPRPGYPAGTPLWQASNYASSHHTATSYNVSGDPPTGQGWIDGIDIPPGDRRMFSTHGPFNLNLHDTAEVILAHVAAVGASNLWSLQILKYNVGFAKYWFNGLVKPSSVVSGIHGNGAPISFEVSQNYPNPFNPTTTVKYQIPMIARVTIKVFNILGQEVATLVNAQRQPGIYSADWNAANVPSGVYFYRTQVTPISGKAGVFVDVKKMVFLK